MKLLDLIAEFPGRVEERNWARDVEPGTVSFADAVDHVAEVLRQQLSDTDLTNGRGSAVFNGLIACERIFGTLRPTGDQIAAAIQRSGEDIEAFDALTLLAQVSSTGEHPNLDAWRLAVFVGGISPPRRPTKSKYTLAHRDVIIVSQVRQLHRLGFKPTRSSATKRDQSGCDIVATATHRPGAGLGMTYAAVERIWKKRDIDPLGNVGKEFLDTVQSELSRRRTL